MTNYDRIKSMSVEEMARAIDEKDDCYYCPINTLHCEIANDERADYSECFLKIKQWLLKEVREDEEKSCY